MLGPSGDTIAITVTVCAYAHMYLNLIPSFISSALWTLCLRSADWRLLFTHVDKWNSKMLSVMVNCKEDPLPWSDMHDCDIQSDSGEVYQTLWIR